MKKLTRIIMVNWYLFEANEWTIKGDTALLGPNGAGKSSFLDAIQYVMFGGNLRDWKPNAKAPAGRKSERDIRGYILGLVKTEESIGDNPEFQPRDEALCRLGLVFTDEETGEPVTVGCAVYARRGEPREDVEGFFILENKELTLHDFLDFSKPGVSIPKPWDDMKALFRAQVRPERCYLFNREPENYVAQLLRSLCPADRVPDTAKYRRSFKHSITMSSLDGSVSEFVSNSILDAGSIDISKMKMSIESYKKKKEAVIQTKKQIQRLSEIQKKLESARKLRVNAVAHEWCAAELEFESMDTEITRLVEEMRDHYAGYRNAVTLLKNINRDLAALRQQQSELNILLSSDTNETQYNLLTEQKSSAEKEREGIRARLNNIRSVLESSSGVARYRELLSDAAASILDRMAAHAINGNAEWPANPASTDEIITLSKNILANEAEDLKKRGHETWAENDKAEKHVQELSIRLDNIRHGKTDLSPETLLLIEELKSHGIEATPVCELTEISDEAWQPAIEAFLRRNSEALIVEPAKARQAVEIYRKSRRQGLHNATVVNTEKVASWHEKVQSGTAAALVTGDNAHAVKYLQRLLRNISLVDNLKTLMASDRALTPDGMFAGQGGIQRLKLPDIPKIGKASLQRHIPVLETQLHEAMKMREAAKNTYAIYGKADQQLNKLITHLDGIKLTNPLTGDLSRISQRIADLDKKINAIDLSATKQLRDDLIKIQKEIAKAEEIKSDQDGAKQSEKRMFKDKNKQRKSKKRLIPDLEKTRNEIAASKYFNAEKVDEILSAQHDKNLESMQDYHSAIKNCRDAASRLNSKSNNTFSEGREMLATYNSDYKLSGVEVGEIMNDDAILPSVQGVLTNLIDLGLHEREEEAANAEREVHRVIRKDLAIRLNGQILNMKRRIQELNAELKQRPFSSNLVYQFHYNRIPQTVPFLEFVERITLDDAANVGGLFDDQDEQSEQIAIIKKMLDQDDDGKFSDYRTYFNYDIEIIDQESGIREMLSKKKDTGSGGEQRTPFYVAIGASLASAYRITRESDDRFHGGIGLYLADEAFQNMDEKNTRQAAAYLKSIGLQLFIAAPDESENRLKDIVDTTIFFLRVGAKVAVDVEHSKPKLHELLNSGRYGIDEEHESVNQARA